MQKPTPHSPFCCQSRHTSLPSRDSAEVTSECTPTPLPHLKLSKAPCCQRLTFTISEPQSKLSVVWRLACLLYVRSNLAIPSSHSYPKTHSQNGGRSRGGAMAICSPHTTASRSSSSSVPCTVSAQRGDRAQCSHTAALNRGRFSCPWGTGGARRHCWPSQLRGAAGVTGAGGGHSLTKTPTVPSLGDPESINKGLPNGCPSRS